MGNKARFEYFQGDDHLWYWHLKAANNEVVAQSEGYETGNGVIDGIYAAKDAFLEALSGKEVIIERIWTGPAPDSTPTSSEDAGEPTSDEQTDS